MSSAPQKLGIAGGITRTFIVSPLTPLFLMAAFVVAIVISVTILLTLFASNLMGYTLNRVPLFALIFSISILVDDAIVVIENIARHWGMGDGRDRCTAAIDAVAEVGKGDLLPRADCGSCWL